MPIANLRDLIIEKKAKQIADAWANAVVTQLSTTVPRASGALAEAMLKRTPPERVGHGWVVGIGDMGLIGAGPFDAPPRNTISAFLEMWREEAGGARELGDKRVSKAGRLRMRQEKAMQSIREAEAVRKDREWWSKSYEKEDATRRSIRDAEGAKKRELDRVAEAVDWEVRWRQRKHKRESAIVGLERDIARGVAYGAREVKKGAWVETYRMRKLRGQQATALAREKRWATRATAHQKKADALAARIRAMEARIAAELARRMKRLRR